MTIILLIVQFAIIIVICVISRKSGDGAKLARAAQINRAKATSARESIAATPAKVIVSISTANGGPPCSSVISSPAINALQSEFVREYEGWLNAN